MGVYIPQFTVVAGELGFRISFIAVNDERVHCAIDARRRVIVCVHRLILPSSATSVSLLSPEFGCQFQGKLALLHQLCGELDVHAR